MIVLGLSTKNQPDGGAFIISRYYGSDLFRNGRRYQRVATIDGGMAFESRGLFPADKQMTVVLDYRQDVADVLPENQFFVVSSAEGCYSMFLSDWDITDDGIKLELKGYE